MKDYSIQLQNTRLNKLYKESTELTGNVFTTKYNKKYYGFFSHIEKYFGSSGSSFDDNKIKTGIYSVRFPENVGHLFIDKYVDTIIKLLKTGKKLTFIIWLNDQYETLYDNPLYVASKNKKIFEKKSHINKKIISKIEKNKYFKKKYEQKNYEQKIIIYLLSKK